MAKEVYRDEGLLTGTHQGSDAASALYDPDVHFNITYAIGRLLENTTQDTSGLVTAHTLNTATATGVTWDNGDSYVLYVGATKDAVISSTVICRQSGFAYPNWELNESGIHPDHEDIDRDTMDPRAVRGRGSKNVNRR